MEPKRPFSSKRGWFTGKFDLFISSGAVHTVYGGSLPREPRLVSGARFLTLRAKAWDSACGKLAYDRV
jgi:hypothetical protein